MNLAAVPLLYLAALSRHGALAEFHAAAAAAIEGGCTREEAVDLVAELLDYLTPMEDLLPGVVGKLAEEALDQALERTAARIIDLVLPDPAKASARIRRMQERRDRRRARRSAA